MRSLKVQLEDFRSFKRIDPVHIAPITFLIGQNSTGKTSFLSALNYIFEFQERGSPQLSSEPFDLGSFKQLVHKEQEKSFSIKFSETINLGNSSGLIPFFIRQFSARMFEKPPVKKRELVDASLEIVFSDHFGSAEVCSLKFRIEESLLSIDLRPEFLVELDFDDKLISFEPEGGMQPPPIINSESGLKVGSLILLLQAIVSSFYTNEEVGEDQKEARSMPQVAIRSTPQRVYRAAQASDGPDGKGVPYRLRKIKVSDPKRWTRIRKEVNKFGRESGLFTDFNITKLTDDDAGPFQLKFRVDGRWASIADVGYGISQTLPVIVDLVTKDQKSIYLYQQPEVHLHPQAQAGLGSFLASHIGENSDTIAVIETHSDYLVDRVRMAIRDGVLSKDSVRILFFSADDGESRIDEIQLDRMGQPIDPPNNYRDFFMREELRILGVN